MGTIKDVTSKCVLLMGAFGLLATLSATLPALADGPVTLWYQRGANPEQQRILQKDLVEP
jgi:raffinose/stachyose/melibiose transport system substrate-binding protein